MLIREYQSKYIQNFLFSLYCPYFLKYIQRCACENEMDLQGAAYQFPLIALRKKGHVTSAVM